MNTVEVHIPAKHLAFFRQLVTEEASCDISDSTPGWADMSKEDLEGTAAIAQRAIAILDQLGYPGEGDGEDRIVKLEPSYAAYLVNEALGQMGEDMKEASGEYAASPRDPAAMREVADRTSWVADHNDKFAGIEPLRAVQG